MRQAIIVAFIGVLGVTIGAAIPVYFRQRPSEVEGSRSAQRIENEKLLAKALTEIFGAVGAFADAEVTQGESTVQRCEKTKPGVAGVARPMMVQARRGVEEFKKRNNTIANDFRLLLDKQGEIDTLIVDRQFTKAWDGFTIVKETSARLQLDVNRQVEQLKASIKQSRDINDLSIRCPEQ